MNVARRLALSFALACSLPACAGEVHDGGASELEAVRPPDPAGSTPLARARALAVRDGWLSAAFRHSTPLVATAAGFRSAEPRRGDTAVATFGQRTTDPFTLRAGKRGAPLAELRITGIADAPLAPHQDWLAGVIAPGAVAFHGLAGEALEQMVYVPSGAPLTFSWHLELSADVKDVVQERDGHLAFVRADGRPLLRIPSPYAVDEGGLRRPVAMSWTSRSRGSRLAADVRFVTPDGAGRPLLVDPALEVVFWQRFPGETPPSRHSPAMAYHPGLRATVVYGGSAFESLSDTWAFDGEWRQLEPRTGAPARANHAMSYIDDTRSLVSFGGRDEGGALSSATLLWDGAAWSDARVTGPPARDDHGMAYAPALGAGRNVAFLFGGSGSGGAVRDSFTWNGSAWSPVTAANGPDQRYGSSVFYDSARQSVIVVGGARATLLLADVSGYDGAAWSPFTTAPDARMDHAMAFDSRRRIGVLFGGFDSLDTYAKGTWEWRSDDGSWSERVTPVAPVPRADARMAYDPERERVLLFGGGAGPSFLETSETWEYGVLGGACSTNAECDQFACVDGACCEASRCGPCQRCSAVTGECEPVANGDDEDSCTGASSCDPQGVCKKKRGVVCASAAECISGFCSDGVCCNRACQGACEACDAGDTPGACTLVTGEPRHGTCEGTPPCGAACNGSSASCELSPAGAACGSACTGDRRTESACDGLGRCVRGSAEACPNELRCEDGVSCRTACRGDGDCTPGHTCRDGACRLPADFCEDRATLRRADGAAESCEPYACVSGACLESCSRAAQCARGLVCDASGSCIEPPPAGAGASEPGCGCDVPGKNRTAGAWWGLALATAAALGLRRATAGK